MKQVDEEKVRKIIYSIIQDDPVGQDEDSCSLLDRGMDSLHFIQTIISIEEEFECEIPDAKLVLSELDSVDKIIKMLKELYAITQLKEQL